MWNYTGTSHRGGLGISIPPSETEVTLRGGPPLGPVEEVKAFIKEHLPEIAGAEIVTEKMCWYSDTIDLDFAVDRVLGTRGLLVGTGGGNHGNILRDRRVCRC